MSEEFAGMIQVEKQEGLAEQISDPNVVLAQIDIAEDDDQLQQIIILNFIVLNEATISDLNFMINQNKQLQENKIEDKPWYGSKRYDIVDRVLQLQELNQKKDTKSAVQEAAMQTQLPFLSQSMTELSKKFEGPLKYFNQKDSPLEIPIEVVKKLFENIDQDHDERLSIKELHDYCRKMYLPFEEQTVIDMFKEAASGRGVVHQKQMESPLTLDEVAATVRGRHRWNPQTKQWEVYYRQYRDYWIVLLKTVNERLFAIPIPKVVPTKILAQFEEQDLKQTMKITKKEGIDKKYLSIRQQSQPCFKRDTEKNEAGINLNEATLLQFTSKKQKKVEKNPYEHQVNARILPQEATQNGYPKVTFESKEFYNQAQFLSSHIPYWNENKDNPIYQYVPTTERPFTYDNDILFNTNLQDKMLAQSIREQKLQELQNKERTLQLAGTMALKLSKKCPSEVIKERKGFLTTFKTPGIFEQKTDAAKTQKNKFDNQQREYIPLPDPYQPPSDHKFRDLEIPKTQKDFTLRFKCEQAYNKYGISEHDMRPKEVLDKQRTLDEKEKQQKQIEYQQQLTGIASTQNNWIQYHKLPDILSPVAAKFDDKHQKLPKEKNLFLDKDEYTTAYIQLARQLKDDVVFGKPNFNKYFKTLKPTDLNEEFGGTQTKPFKCIY